MIREGIIKTRDFLLEGRSWLYPAGLLVLCFFIWGMPGRGLLYFGDVQASYIFYPEKVYGSFSIWKDLYNGGTTNYGIFQNYIFSFLVIVSHALLQLDLHSYFYSFLGFFVFSMSFFFLYRKIFKNDFIAFIIGIFALLSPITLTYHSGILLIYSLAFINFALLFLYDVFFAENKKGIAWREIFLASIFFTLANVYLQNFFLYLYILPFFILFHFRHIYRQKIFLLKNAAVLGISYVLLNVFWIYLLVHQAFSSRGNFFGMAIQSSVSMDVANLITKLTSVVNFYRLVPYFSNSGGDVLASYNGNTFLLFSSFAIALFAFLSIFFDKEKKFRKGIMFSLVLFVLTFPILNGNKEPFKDAFLFFWDHIPLAETFRTFTKLMFINLYAISYLLGVSLYYLIFRIGSVWMKILCVFIAAFPVVVYNAPVMREKFLLQEKIPQYYFEMKKKFSQPLNANTMMSPQTNWLVTYKWRTKEKDTDNIFPFFYNGRVFTNGASYTQDQEWQNYNNLSASYIINQSLEKLGSLFSYKNVGFVSLQDDIDSFLDFKDESRITTESNIKGSSSFFKKIAQYGDVYIYEIPDRYFNHQIFSPKEIYSIRRSSSKKTNLVVSSPFIISSLLTNSIKTTDASFIFTEQNHADLEMPKEDFKKILFNYQGSLFLDYASPIDSPKIQAVSKGLNEGDRDTLYEVFDIKRTLLNKSDIEFRKTSAAQYEVFIHKAKPGKVPVIFSETYDLGWDLYASSLIDDKEESGDYKCVKSEKKCKAKQATKKEVETFLTERKIIAVGPNYISKSYNGSVQNDNLDRTPLTSLVFDEKLQVEHLYANGYSNLFIVDIRKVCESRPESCIVNDDGTYDVRMVVFFTPQRNFYLILMVTIVFWATLLLYFITCYSSKFKAWIQTILVKTLRKTP